MQVIQQLWKGRRVRVAGSLPQIAVESPDDLEAIYLEHHRLIHRRCLATLKDEEAARDATQDVFLAALGAFEEIRHDVLRGLLDLARSISYERKRRPAREVPLADPPSGNGRTDDPAEIAERNTFLDTLWSGLSEVERRYVADKFAGFSFEEIAHRNHRALGTVSSNLARAREHARKIGEPMLLGSLAALAWRRLGDLGRRARVAAQDTSVAAAASPVGSLTVSLTLAGLIAGALPAASAASAVASRPLVPAALSTSADMAGTLPAGSVLSAPAPGTSASVTGSRSGAGATGGGLTLPRLLPSGSASSETPEDTEIISATPSPNYQQDHTIVALGHGATCNCEVVLMSTDGGANWDSAQGPPAGTQIVLSPTFPQDPAIYVGYLDQTGNVGDYRSPGFRQEFKLLTGAPAGELALPAGFDRGDNRILISNSAGVWSYDERSRVVHPLLVDPAKVPPSLATPIGAPGVGVLVMTSSQAVAAGGVPETVPSSGEALWSCPPAGPCSEAATVNLLPGSHLAVSPGFQADETLVGFSGASLLASSDAGRHFADLGLPAGTRDITAVLVSPTATGTGIWATIATGRSWELVSRASLGAPWQVADGGDAAITQQGGRLLVVGAQRLLFLLAQGGLRCSVNGGVTWEARCPST
jgi:DNA-directed RNA polymerase specialized sigma24 family protein